MKRVAWPPQASIAKTRSFDLSEPANEISTNTYQRIEAYEQDQMSEDAIQLTDDASLGGHETYSRRPSVAVMMATNQQVFNNLNTAGIPYADAEIYSPSRRQSVAVANQPPPAEFEPEAIPGLPVEPDVPEPFYDAVQTMPEPIQLLNQEIEEPIQLQQQLEPVQQVQFVQEEQSQLVQVVEEVIPEPMQQQQQVYALPNKIPPPVPPKPCIRRESSRDVPEQVKKKTFYLVQVDVRSHPAVYFSSVKLAK